MDIRGVGKNYMMRIRLLKKSEWTTIILTYHAMEADAYSMEAILVNRNTVADKRCLNIKTGGLGQQDNFKHTEVSKAKISDAARAMWKRDYDALLVITRTSRNTPEVRAKVSASSIEAGKDPVLRKTRSVNAKRMIARPEHIAALMAGRFTPENNARAGATHTAINDKARQERFPPALVQEIFNSTTPQRKLADEHGCSRSTIKKIKRKDTLFNYAWG